jgi:uncharacterized protein Veg
VKNARERVQTAGELIKILRGGLLPGNKKEIAGQESKGRQKQENKSVEIYETARVGDVVVKFGKQDIAAEQGQKKTECKLKSMLSCYPDTRFVGCLSYHIHHTE